MNRKFCKTLIYISVFKKKMMLTREKSQILINWFRNFCAQDTNLDVLPYLKVNIGLMLDLFQIHFALYAFSFEF